MTECNSCGACCDPVVLAFTQTEARTRPGLHPADRRFVLEDLTPMGRDEARAKTGWIAETEARTGEPWRGADGSPIPFFFRCRWFDETSRRCTNYEGRPPMCSDYPVRFGRVGADAALPPTCSFRADQGLPVEPVS